MTTLFTADLHLNDNPRDEYRHDFMHDLPMRAKKIGADRLVILGDLTEQKDGHNARLVNRVVKYLYDLSRILQVIIVQGNHDYAHLDWPFFSFVDMVNNVTWIDQPKGVGLELFLPHTHDHEKDWKGIDFLKYKWVYTHNTFAGAVSEGGQKLEGIPTGVFRKAVRVISGDVHVPQVIDCVTFVGAPYTIDFGDAYDPRMLELEGGKLRSLCVLGPRKRAPHITLDNPSRLERILTACAEHHEYEEGDILKVRVYLKMEYAAQWWEIRDLICKWGEERGFVIDSVQPIIVTAPDEEQGRAEPRKVKSDETLVRQYAKRKELDPATLKVGLAFTREK